MKDLRARALQLIRSNIERHGFHVYVVEQHSTPRVVYTIGLSDALGAELVLAGAIYYLGDHAMRIVHSIREQAGASDSATAVYSVEGLGTFTLRKAHESWTRELLLGAADYYRSNDVAAYQIVPDANHHTIDIPDMTKQWTAGAEPVWRWEREPWPYRCPETSTATTNLAALRGQRVTEVARWERDEWEMFAGAGPDVTEAEMRVVPVGCLVGVDPSLAPALDLEIGESLWRDDDGGSWNVWESSSKK